MAYEGERPALYGWQRMQTRRSRFVLDRRGQSRAHSVGMLALAALLLLLAGFVAVWKRGGFVPEPEGKIATVRFFFNPRLFVENYGYDIAGQGSDEYPDHVFIVSLDAELAGRIAEDVFKVVDSGEGAFRASRWTYPYVEIVTDRGTYILKLRRETVRDVLGPGREDANILYLYDRGGDPSPRLRSPVLTRAIVGAILAAPELHSQLRMLMRGMTRRQSD